MWKKPHLALTGLVLVLVIVLLSLPSGPTNRLKLVLGSVFLPLFGLAGSVHGASQEAAGRIMPRSALIAENQSLRQANANLQVILQQSQAATDENARLRRLLGWQPNTLWKPVAGRIVSRDPATWWRTFRIDLGSRNGVRKDLPVMSPEGLIGRTTEVGLGYSQVALVGDPACRVAVLVRETGEQGIISQASEGVLDHRLVDLTHLPRAISLKAGQTVVTSGQGGVFPAGLLVGTVVDARTVGFGLYSEARIKLSSDSSRASEVLVLLPPPGVP